MIEKIALMSKRDIPYEPASFVIHQPSLKEISYIGENNFFKGCQYLTFSKNSLDEKDKLNLEKVTDFEVLLMILNKNDSTIEQMKIYLQLLFLLILPDYKVVFLPTSILLSRKTLEGFEECSLTKENFEGFKNIVSEMFCLKYIQGNETANGKYNPKGTHAKAIADKIYEGRAKVAKLKGKSNKLNVLILYRYVSILSVGLKKDINLLMSYSLYQLIDLFRRFKLYEDWETMFRLKLAGAKDVQTVQNWMSDLDDNSLLN